jgi:hypothetical protein
MGVIGFSKRAICAPSYSDRTPSVYDRLEVEMKSWEPSPPYLTTERPRFELEIRNISEKPVEGELTLFIGFGNAGETARRLRHVDVNLDPQGGNNDTKEVDDLGGEELLYNTPLVIGVIPPNQSDHPLEDDDLIEIERAPKPRTGKIEAVFSSTVWDPHYYRTNVVVPLILTAVLVVLTVLLVVLTIVLVI